MRKQSILVVLWLVFGMMLVVASCHGGEKESNPLAQPANESPSSTQRIPLSPLRIIIGNLTDMTGPSANAQMIINTALNDLVKYYNSENIIPGVELEVITYDGQLDPAKDIPGYEWLKEHGANLIYTGVPDTSLTLKSRVDREKMPLFAASGYQEMLDPPGYVFVLGTIPTHQAYTVLDWIAENDWDYLSRGPAKIGGASWTDGYSESFLAAMKEYAHAHPDQFEWIGGYLTSFTFNWGTEAEALRDCDYVFPCVMPVAFIKEYRKVNGTAKFICADAQTGFFGQINNAELWDELDGSLFVRGGSLWWNEKGPLVDLTRELLYQNHLGEAEEIIRTGSGYLSISGIFYPMLDIIARAVETVGLEGFGSQAIYEAAIDYSLKIDGVERSSFTETRRYAITNYMIYKASLAEKDIVRVDKSWVAHLVEP